MMSEEKEKQGLSFISAGDSSDAGVCGPNGCNIAAHKDLVDKQEKKENK